MRAIRSVACVTWYAGSVSARVTAETPCARRSVPGLAPGASGIGAFSTKNSTSSRNWGSDGTRPPRSYA